MRLTTLFALIVCFVFISSGFRTVFGEDEVSVVEENHATPKSDEGLVEPPPALEEQSESVPVTSGDHGRSGKLQEDPGHVEAEPIGSAEAHDENADLQNTDVENVENVPHNPEADPAPDGSRSGNLDIPFGKRTLHTVTGKCGVCGKNMVGLMGRKIWGTFLDSANKVSFVLFFWGGGVIDAMIFIPESSQCKR
jgi:hypothetical protein